MPAQDVEAELFGRTTPAGHYGRASQRFVRAGWTWPMFVVLLGCGPESDGVPSASDSSTSVSSADDDGTDGAVSGTGQASLHTGSSTESEDTRTGTSESSVGDADGGMSTGGVTSITDDGTTGVADVCATGGYPESLAAWQDFRDENDDTYHYVGRRVAGECGFGACCTYQTLLVVHGGIVVRRSMTSTDVNPDDEEECAEAWDEMGEDVGTHTDGAPAPPWNLDDVYASCCDFVFHLDPDDWAPVLHVHDSGLLHRCLGVDNNGGNSIGPLEWGLEINVSEIAPGDPPR